MILYDSYVSGSLVVSGSILQGGGALAAQDGTILYHNIKWFTPSSTVSTSGTTVTSVGTQFSFQMVGAKLTINGESRLISIYSNSSQVTVDSAYSQNYSAVTASNWGVFGKSITFATADNTTLNGGFEIRNSTNGSLITAVYDRIQIGLRLADAGNNVAFNTTGVAEAFQLANDKTLVWYSGSSAAFNALNTSRDTGLRKNSPGILEIYNGNTADGAVANRRDLILRNITGSNALFSGTTASDYPTLGSELLTTGDGTSWTGSAFSTGYAHTTGSIVALTSSLAAINGGYYQTSITVAGRTSGSFSFTFGGATTTGVSSTTSFALAAISTGTFALTPSTDFDGTASISLKQITVASTPTLIISNTATSSVLSNLEIRVPSGSTGNTFIGYQSGRYNTTATGNTFIGYQAGAANIGVNNTFIGYRAGAANTTGNGNVAIGYTAGASLTTGYNNTIINVGISSMSTGANNTIIGFFAGRLNSTGFGNVFIGRDSGRDGVSISDNVFVGNAAGSYVTSGGSNTFIGIGAGSNFGGSSANPLTTSNSSILIGVNTYPLANSQTNQIVIGNGTTGLGSNSTIIGTTSTTTTAIYGNLLLGSTTDSGYKLDVTGTARVSSAVTFSSGQTGGYVTSTSGYVNETRTVSTNATSYYLIKYTGTSNGSSTTTFDITGMSTNNGTYADIYAIAQKDATANAINTNVGVSINGQTINLPTIQANGTGANTVRCTFRVCRMESTWVIIGLPNTTYF